MPGKSRPARTALVVGASRGLGLGLVRELTTRGWQVTATTRSGDSVPTVQSAGAVAVERLDIDDTAAVDALVHRLEDRRFDLVFMNAGVIGPAHRSLERATREEIAQLMQTNAISPIRLAQRLLPLIPPGGTLAFMTSILGSVGGNTTGGTVLYRASKAALNSLTRSLVADLAGTGITVLSVHPGWVRTDMGGPNATLDVETSVRGVVDQVEQRAGTGTHAFIDYAGVELPW
jgi:NAD(P)-dependent dehydrogenase (short-subunit alcohol dehydrogenase family)